MKTSIYNIYSWKMKREMIKQRNDTTEKWYNREWKWKKFTLKTIIKGYHDSNVHVIHFKTSKLFNNPIVSHTNECWCSFGCFLRKKVIFSQWIHLIIVRITLSLILFSMKEPIQCWVKAKLISPIKNWMNSKKSILKRTHEKVLRLNGWPNDWIRTQSKQNFFLE